MLSCPRFYSNSFRLPGGPNRENQSKSIAVHCHSWPAASLANVSQFHQTALSKVSHRSVLFRVSAKLRWLTPDKVLALQVSDLNVNERSYLSA